MQIEPGGASKSKLRIEECRDAMLPRDALACWFDDIVGDRLDSFAAQMAGKRDWSISGLARRKILDLS